MAGRFARSWALVQASTDVLRKDKELLLFPALSSICAIVVAASFFVPMFQTGMFEHVDRQHQTPGFWIAMFAFYVVQYSVINFFNVALVGAALIRLRGGDPTVADGFRIALSKLPAILGYAVISATVGVILRMLQERAGFIGRWIIAFIGLAWTIATFLAVPVLVAQDVGPIEAVQRSAALLKKSWGENLIGNAGIGVVFGLIMFLLVICCAIVIFAAAQAHSAVLLAFAIGFAVIAAIVVALIQAALQGIYAAAVYRYAAEGEVGAGFDQALIAQAFTLKA